MTELLLSELFELRPSLSCVRKFFDVFELTILFLLQFHVAGSLL